MNVDVAQPERLESRRVEYCPRQQVMPVKPEQIDAVHWIIADESIQVDPTYFLNRITIDKPLQIRIVEAIEVIHETGRLVMFFGTKAICVRISQRARFGQDVSKGIVRIARDDQLFVIHERGDISVSVGMIEGVGLSVARVQLSVVGARQQATDL